MTKDEILSALLKNKTCHRCKNTWPVEIFGNQFYCRECINDYHREYGKRKRMENNACSDESDQL